jgi:hypothetical protein
MTIWRMHIANWIPKATNTLTEYIIVFIFPLEQCGHERALLLLWSTFRALLLILNM